MNIINPHAPDLGLSLVVAASKNNIIGRDGDLPWRQPTDLKRFRAITSGHPVIMGRRTYQSLPAALPNRTNIVVSRSMNKQEGVLVTDSLDQAFQLAAECCYRDHLSSIMVIGGGQIYRETLPLAREVYLTVIDTHIEGDTMFPTLDPDKWHLASSEIVTPDARDDHAMQFCHYTRKAFD